MKKSLIAAVILALALPLLGLGCNPFQSAQDRVASGIISGATGGKVNVDSQNGKVEIKGENGDQTVSMGSEETGVAIPSDLPSDMAIYPGSKALLVMRSKENNSDSVSLLTGDDQNTVKSWYVDKYKDGWKQEASMDLGEGVVLVYSKDKVRIQITIGSKAGDQNNKTSILVTRSEEK